MKLIRLATIYLELVPKVENREPKDFKMRFDHVLVAVQNFGKVSEAGKHLRLLAQASVDLSTYPKLTDDNQILIPEEERKAAEAGIEATANILSVTERCKRSISSPYPYVMLYAGNDTDLKWLENSAGMIGNSGQIPDTLFNIELSEKIIRGLLDRLDGVALLAEALANSHSTGRYRELIRFFERAFSLPTIKIRKKLTRFLEGANLGYSRTEINKWVDLRDPSIHADGEKTETIVLESDVRYVVPRMEQAAYDILFNKLVWKNSSKERRNFWRPLAATNSHSHTIKMTPGLLGLSIQSFDPFNAYPTDSFPIQPPSSNHWSKWAMINKPIIELQVGPKNNS